MSVEQQVRDEPETYAARTRYLVAGRRARTAVGWTGVAVGLVGLVCRELPVTWQPAVLAATFSPYLALGSLLGGVLLAWHTRWVGTALAVATVAVTVAAHAPLFSGSASTVADGVPLTVLQANLKLGTADAESIVDLVRDHDVDVLAVEELTTPEIGRLDAAGLGDLLPHHFLRGAPGGSGTGLWSRYPLSDTYAHEGFALATLSAKVTAPDAQPTTVFAVHVTPPWPYAPSMWNAQLTRLQSDMVAAGRSGPVFAAGDFNSTWDQQRFRHLVDGGFADAAELVGAGWTPTYPADKPWPPLITIDHVLVRDVGVGSLETVTLPGSDHRGLLTRLQLPRAAG